MAALMLVLAGCDIDLFGFDAKTIVAPYRLLVCEGGEYLKTKAIAGPIDPTQIAARPDLAELAVVDADAAWNKLKR